MKFVEGPTEVYLLAREMQGCDRVNIIWNMYKEISRNVHRRSEGRIRRITSHARILVARYNKQEIAF